MANACKQQNNVSEAGIGKLSLLPLFLNLKGKRVIVIGASQGAKWKAELLAAAGAQVEHCDTAPTPGSALLEYLGDAAFAIADIADEDEARNFAMTAKRAGVAYNIVDKPDYVNFNSARSSIIHPLLSAFQRMVRHRCWHKVSARELRKSCPRTWARGVPWPNAYGTGSRRVSQTTISAARYGSVCPKWP